MCTYPFPAAYGRMGYDNEKKKKQAAWMVQNAMALREALNVAIDYCMEHHILYEILREYRSEVLGMLLEEFDVDKYERTIRMEGVEQGIEQGIQRANRLTQLLLEQNRIGDLSRSLQDEEYQKALFEEFHL